jgi:hypothetical protein
MAIVRPSSTIEFELEDPRTFGYAVTAGQPTEHADLLEPPA